MLPQHNTGHKCPDIVLSNDVTKIEMRSRSIHEVTEECEASALLS